MKGFFVLCLAVSAAGHALATGNGSTAFDVVRAAALVGTGEGFGGGDPRLDPLRVARRSLERALALIAEGADVATLCQPRHAPSKLRGKGGELYRLLSALDGPQASRCRSFLRESVAELRELNRDTKTKLLLSEAPLLVAGQPVAAMTERNEKGVIVFHYGTILAMTPAQHLALLTHELGHKTKGRFEDERPVGPFAEGRRFLDAVGAAVAFYAEDHPEPAQAPTAMPAGVTAAAACGLLEAPNDALLVGLFVDTRGTLPTAEEIAVARRRDRATLAKAFLADPSARRHELTRQFRRALLRDPSTEETALLLDKFTAGESPAQVFAAMLGDEEYGTVRGLSGTKPFVESVFQDLVGRAPTAAERGEQLARFDRLDRASVAHLVLTQHPEARERLVDGWYRELLNRPPTDTERQEQAERLRDGHAWNDVRAAVLGGGEYGELQRARWRPCSRKVASTGKKVEKR